MADKFRVALIGDFDPSVIAHQAIPEALATVCPLRIVTRSKVLYGPRRSRFSNVAVKLRDFDGIWCVPASPYASMEGALEAIRFARSIRDLPRNLRRFSTRSLNMRGTFATFEQLIMRRRIPTLRYF